MAFAGQSPVEAASQAVYRDVTTSKVKSRLCNYHTIIASRLFGSAALLEITWKNWRSG